MNPLLPTTEVPKLLLDKPEPSAPPAENSPIPPTTAGPDTPRFPGLRKLLLLFPEDDDADTPPLVVTPAPGDVEELAEPVDVVVVAPSICRCV